MDDCERYLFDLSGFLHIPGLLSATEASGSMKRRLSLRHMRLPANTIFPDGGRSGDPSIGRINNMPILRTWEVPPMPRR